MASVGLLYVIGAFSVIFTVLAHQIGVSGVFTNLREFYLTYPVSIHGMIKNVQKTSDHILMLKLACHIASQRTVNLGHFARFLFSRNFADAKFRENKTLAKCCFLMQVNHTLVARKFFSVANMSFNAIR